MKDSKEVNNDYQARIQKVLDYIRNHLSESLEIADLAAIGNFSMFHFHRIIRAYLNEPLGAHIKRIRLETAAQLLRYSDVPISEICHQMGYEMPSSFTNAFRKRFGMSPIEFRNQQQQTMEQTTALEESIRINFDLTPEIVNIPAKKIVTARVLGNYESDNISKAWGQLMGYVFQNQLFHSGMEMLGIAHDHPDISGDALYHYEACVTLEKSRQSEGEFTVKELPAGKYATFTHKRSYELLDSLYNFILKNWLLSSKYELREAPLFDHYLNTPQNTPQEELLTKIFIPIQAKS